MKRFGKLWLMLIVLFQAAAGIAGGIGAAAHYYENRIIPGLEVGSLLLGGLAYEEARDLALRELVSPLSATLSWGGKNFCIPLYYKIEASEVEEVLEKALEMGKFSGSNHYFFNIVRWAPLSVSLKIPLSVPAFFLFDELHKIKKEIDREPEDARVEIVEGIPLVIDEQPGRILDFYRSKKCVEEHLQRGCYAGIPLVIEEKPSRITRDDLPDFSGLIASFSTPLDDSAGDRRHNIGLAMEAINGRIIEPGEQFSFNSGVGPVTAVQGYKEALVIQNRKFVYDTGGGICQVASTLYRVALQGEMKIIQRLNHSRPVSYIPLGQDATVVQGHIDLQFANNRQFPVLLAGKMDDHNLTFFLYGARQETGRSVEIVTEDLEVLPPRLLEQPDPSLPKGVRQPVQEGEEGYRVSVYRLIRDGDQKTIKELVSRDVYMPINEVLRVGTKDVAKRKK